MDVWAIKRKENCNVDVKYTTLNDITVYCFLFCYHLVVWCTSYCMFLTVLQRVLQREHRIEGQKLHVALYYKELGLLPPGIDGSSQFEAIPSDVAVDCSPEIAAFILRNPPVKHQVMYFVTVSVTTMFVQCL